jgi:transposase-like protein
MAEKFDFEAALKAVQSGQSITGKDGILRPLVKQLTEAALEGELESHLADEVADKRRNGKSRKTVKSSSGAFELETPRDRAGTASASPARPSAPSAPSPTSSSTRSRQNAKHRPLV